MTQRVPFRIGLLGGESTGKTTLAQQLADAVPAFIGEEYLREFVSTFGRVPSLADQEGIFLTQQATMNTVLRAAAHVQTPAIVADPLPVMTAVYSLLYFDNHDLLVDGLADAATYDLIVWCRPDVGWASDRGQRDGQAYALAADGAIGTHVWPELSEGNRLDLAGDPGNRLDRVLAALPT